MELPPTEVVNDARPLSSTAVRGGHGSRLTADD